ncbi:hypothetical protein KKE74_00315 [Patescibacteria group bacterium]|nr:hypothetical protein [Patescibacteria group bacterium]MBU2472461.1 hypothetical protein [Patescibacteria group bacterium]
MKKLIILDGNALIYRAFYALPPLKNKQGKLTNAVYGFTSILFRFIQELNPDYLIATFDLQGPTFRNLEYKEYKAKRVKAPQDLYDQIPMVKEVVKSLNIPIYEKQGFEADDVIGTIVQKTKNEQIKNIIITGDLDTLQLVDQKTEVYTPKKGVKDMFVYDQKSVKERFDLNPKQIIDLKGLQGDSSDNIPGVPNIGKKTAVGLLKQFGSLENLYKKLEASDLNPKLKSRLLEYKDLAFLSYNLATIKKNVPIDFNLKKCEWGGYKEKEVIKLLEELGFKSLIKRLGML